jgi:hypothetical protein
MRQLRHTLRRSIAATLALAVVLTGALALALAAMSSPVAHAQPLPTGLPAASGHVTIIVLDMSGSMAQNDPSGLRCSAANAYIDLSGPGDFVGVVGLDNPGGARGGPHNFQTTVDWGLAPREMATVNARKALHDAIAQKSNNCRPDAATPTYDALAKAEAMLASATNGGASHTPGSAILLTDGVPDPDTSAQQSAIQSELVPQFKQHGWPIDVIALGSDTSFHGFLSGIASATSGTFYDDGHGIVPGVSPLNITPFFLDIFRLRNGRSPGPDIAPTQLGGGVTARNFTVGQYVSHLDIVVVKDASSTSVALLAPNGQRFPPATAGTFISSDPYYAIFAIDTPQQGPWEVDVSGSGLFLMDSLKVSALALGITSPAANAVLALGEQFTLSASLSAQGTPISGGRFSLSGTITYAGGGASSYTHDILLADASGSGTYTAPLTVPASAPSGSYTISVHAHAASEDVLTAQTTVRLDLFPAALLIAPTSNTPTTDAVGASVVGWDPLLRAIYRLPVIGGLGGLALQNHPADPAAVVRGQVLLDGRPYGDATVGGTATHAGSTSSVPVSVLNDSNGAFRLIFPSDASGTYRVNLTTSGAYNISHGDLTHVARTVLVTIVPATAPQELRAWLVTFIYLLLFALLLLVIRYAVAQKPFGMLVNSDGSGGSEFARARRGVDALLAPGRVTSRQMGMDPGLVFGFHRGGRITVRGTAGRANYRLGGDRVPATPISATETELSLANSPESYTVVSGSPHTSRALDAYDEDDERPNKRAELLNRIRGRRPSDDDDAADHYEEDERPRRGFALFSSRRRRYDEYNAEDDDRYDVAPRTSARRGRGRRDDDDLYGDDAYAERADRRAGRGRGRRRYDDD